MDTQDEGNLIPIRRTVGMVFQNPDNQIVANVVEEDVAFAPENLGVPSQEIRRRVDEALRQVGLYEYRGHAPHLLSGGQKAAGGHCRSHCHAAQVHCPGRTYGDAGPRGREEVMEIVSDLNRRLGITVILITHHMDEAARAQRVVVLDRGKLRQTVPEKGLQPGGAAAPPGPVCPGDCGAVLAAEKGGAGAAAGYPDDRRMRAGTAPLGVGLTRWRNENWHQFLRFGTFPTYTALERPFSAPPLSM